MKIRATMTIVYEYEFDEGQCGYEDATDDEVIVAETDAINADPMMVMNDGDMLDLKVEVVER